MTALVQLCCLLDAVVSGHIQELANVQQQYRQQNGSLQAESCTQPDAEANS
jgi:hypothetical protein